MRCLSLAVAFGKDLPLSIPNITFFKFWASLPFRYGIFSKANSLLKMRTSLGILLRIVSRRDRMLFVVGSPFSLEHSYYDHRLL
jgi:hypothetical protein